MDQDEAFVGLDRKAWTSDVSETSESYQITFDIPENQQGACSVLDNIEVSINGFNATNNIPNPCYLFLWTHALNCADNDPISCDEILFDSQGLQTSFVLDGEDVTEGGSVGIDIVVVIDLPNPACMADAISSGLYMADFEICLIANYVPDEVEDPLDLGDDIFICPGQTVDLEGPDNFEEYEWEGPIDWDEQILEDAIPGLYTLEVTDDNGCRSSDDIEVEEVILDEIEYNLASPIVFCNGNVDDLEVINFTPISEYKFEWDDPAGNFSSGSEITPSLSGNYTVTVTDLTNGCTVEDVVSINIVSSYAAQIQGDTTSCNQDSLTLSNFIPATDSLGFIYEWVFNSDTSNAAQVTLSGSGQLILNLTDSLGCSSASDTTTIVSSIPESAGEDFAYSACDGESIDFHTLLEPGVSVNGSFFLEDTGLINGQTVLQGPALLEYEYIVFNVPPCPNDTALLFVTVNDSDIDAGGDAEQIVCNDEQFDLSDLVTGDIGGSFYDSNNQVLPSPFIDAANLNAGINQYYYIVSSLMCGNDTSVFNIDVRGSEVFSFEPTICLNGSLTINNNVYDINNASGTEVLQSINGCDSTVDIILDFYPQADSLLELQLCNNDTIIIHGEAFYLNSPISTITLSGQSINGCDSIIDVDIEFRDFVSENINDIICRTSQVIVNGNVYDFNNSTGTEMLMAASGCDSVINVDLNFYSPNEQIFEAIICDDEEITIGTDIYNASNTIGTSILVNADINGCDSIVNVFIDHRTSTFESQQIELCETDSIFLMNQWVNTDGTYVDSLQTSFGCDSIVTTQLSVVVCTVSLNGAASDESCYESNDGSYEFSIPVNNQYPLEYKILDDGGICIDSGTINDDTPISSDNLGAGNYTISIIKGNSEILSEDFTIIAGIEITTAMMASDISCPGAMDGTVEVMPGGGTGTLDVLWSTGDDFISLDNLGPGNYTVTVTDDNNCSEEETVTLTEPVPLSYTVQMSDINCPGNDDGTIEVLMTGGGTGFYQFALNGSTPSDNSSFANLGPGSYIVTMIDGNDCELTENVELIVLSNSQLNLTGSATIDFGDSLTLQPNINFNPASIQWSPSSGLSCSDCLNPIASPSSQTNYMVNIVDEFGCQLTSSISIDVIIPELPEIFIPNIYTPNSQDANDLFKPFLPAGGNTAINIFRIFDRWGNLVFSETQNQEGWNGLINNKEAEQGVYLYHVEYQDLLGQTKTVTGDILLVR